MDEAEAAAGEAAPAAAEASSPGDGRGRPGAKRVTFPSDEDIVSGAVEPKDPWRHGEGTGKGRGEAGGGGGEGRLREWGGGLETAPECP